MTPRSPLDRGIATLRRLRHPSPMHPGLAVPGGAAEMLALSRGGPAPPARRSVQRDGPLRIAAVIPSFRRGSGGHRTIVRLLLGLQARGHEVSLWLDDNEARHAAEPAGLTQRSFAAFFGASGLRLHTDLTDWEGADVALATGWQTAPRVMMMPEVGAKAYLVQDHEPDFYPASAEAVWAAQTYRMGMLCIAASGWLAALLEERYGAWATHFDLGVDEQVYRPLREGRQQDLIVFYARAVTARRAVPLGLTALAELAKRRPGLQIQLFGEDRPQSASAAHLDVGSAVQLGVLDEAELARLYSRATVGIVFSLTNPSLICLEMMACGLPCVELATASMTSTFGTDGPLQLAQPDPLSICEAIERLLDDPARRESVSKAGLELVSKRSWQTATAQVEGALRQALSAARAA